MRGYDSTCPQCRKLDGHPSTSFDEKKLCHKHMYELVERLKAENEAMQRRLMAYERHPAVPF